MGRNGHDGTRSIAGKHIFGNPDRNLLARERVDGIGAGEHTRHTMIHLALTLGALLHIGEIFVDGCLLLRSGELLHEFALGSQHHECHTEDGVGTRGEDGELYIAVSHFELHLRTFRTTNPVALGFLQRVGPVDGLQAVEESLGIGRHAQTPLAHLLLFYGIAAALRYTVHHLVVGEYGAESRTPVHHCLTEIGDAVVHQHFLLLLLRPAVPLVGRELQLLRLCHTESFQALGAVLLEISNQLRDGTSFRTLPLAFGRGGQGGEAVEAFKHLLERPLCPMIIARLTSAYLTTPVEGETNLVQLLAVAVDVLFGGDSRMLTRLDGILLGGKSIGIVAHRVQDIEALQSLVASIDIAGDVSQRMTHMQACPTGVWEHVEYVEFLLVFVFGDAIGTILHPSFLPLLFDVSEVIIHKYKS